MIDWREAVDRYYLMAWLHLKADVKKAAVVECRREDQRQVQRWLQNHGCFTRIVDDAVLNERGFPSEAGFVFSAMKETLAADVERAYIAEQSARFEQRETAEITEELTDLLGYPRCCVDAFEHLHRQDDRFLVRSSYYRTAGRIDPLCLMLVKGSLSLLQHTPCSLNCKASRAIAEKVLHTARIEVPEFARRVETLLSRSLLFIDAERYLRFESRRDDNRGHRVEGRDYDEGEIRLLNRKWLDSLPKNGCITEPLPGYFEFEIPHGESIPIVERTSPALPIFLHPNEDTGLLAPPKILLLETFPNDEEQVFSSIFPRLYAGDIAENGIAVQYVQYHHRVGDDAFNAEMIERTVELATREACTQVYYFRTYPHSLAAKLRETLPDSVPHVLLDNTTPTHAGEMTHFMPMTNRADLVRTIVAFARGKQPVWVKANRPGGTISTLWKDLDSTTHRGLIVEEDHPLDLGVSPVVLNRYVSSTHPPKEIVGRPTCPHLKDCSKNPAYEGIDLQDVPYNKGCAFCTTRIPGWEPVSKDKLLVSLKKQLDEVLRNPEGDPVVRVLDQDCLSLIEALVLHVHERGHSPITWLLDSRVTHLLASEKILHRTLHTMTRLGHRLDLFCIGFENFSAAELERFNKGTTPQQNRDAVKLIDHLEREFPQALARTKASSGFILFSPWTTVEDLETNLQAFRELNFFRYRGGAVFTRMRLYQDTAIYRMVERDGLLRDRMEEAQSDVSRFGYSPEEYWAFQHGDVARIWKLVDAASPHQRVIDEAKLLEYAIRFVQKNEASSDEVQRFTDAFPEFFPRKAVSSQHHEKDTSRETVAEAIARIEALAKINETTFRDYNELGRLYAQQEKYQSAMAHFMKARALHPDHPDAPLGVAQMLLHMGKRQKAEQLLLFMQKRFHDSGTVKKVKSLLEKTKAEPSK